VGSRAGLDRCGKFPPPGNSIPGPSSPKSVSIPTELPGPLIIIIMIIIIIIIMSVFRGSTYITVVVGITTMKFPRLSFL
jgi:hypothetical protein